MILTGFKKGVRLRAMSQTHSSALQKSMSHLNVIFNEAGCLHTSLYIETDVHLHLCLLVSQLDDWNLNREEYYSI